MKALTFLFFIMTFACTFTISAQEATTIGKESDMNTLSEADKETIRKQVRDQFNELVSAINNKNDRAWSEHYSKDGFVSAFAGTDYFAARSAWVDTITSYFLTRESQQLEPLAVQVTPLTSDVALMTSQNKTEMRLKGGQAIKSTHVFTMVWKKEHAGWKILHSHESWVDEQAK
ncbi:MAG TPA: nuclear transport factor 2 family protein [Desulfobacteraceae bacterium]|nr:nuclear transport factor 2 family protein [Desulfobacteraceae bacterium]HPQ28257.1 nuclear transport factor 2 family protein [Desulfobacteraceae bacterium]